MRARSKTVAADSKALVSSCNSLMDSRLKTTLILIGFCSTCFPDADTSRRPCISVRSPARKDHSAGLVSCFPQPQYSEVQSNGWCASPSMNWKIPTIPIIAALGNAAAKRMGSFTSDGVSIINMLVPIIIKPANRSRVFGLCCLLIMSSNPPPTQPHVHSTI